MVSSINQTPNLFCHALLPRGVRLHVAEVFRNLAMPRPSLEVTPALRVSRCFNDTSRFARDLSEGLDYKAGVRFILSLDYHHVFDRCFQSTGEVLRVLNQRPEILVLLCSKCSTDALITNACDEVGNLCGSTGYSVRHFPCFFIPRADKSDKLWESLGHISSLRGLPLIHVDALAKPLMSVPLCP